MRYEAPERLSAREIENILSRSDESPANRIKAVLSAIYFGDTIEYSGDTIINEFSKAAYEEKIYLAGIFETFHQMCWTNYRIDESIDLLRVFERESPHRAPEIQDIIDGLLELRRMIDEDGKSQL